MRNCESTEQCLLCKIKAGILIRYRPAATALIHGPHSKCADLTDSLILLYLIIRQFLLQIVLQILQRILGCYFRVFAQGYIDQI